MATIVNNPGVPVDRSDSGAGWAVAVIVLLALVVGAYFVWGNFRGAAPASTNVNVTLPDVGGAVGGAAEGVTQ